MSQLLCVHAGSERIDKAILYSLPTPPPRPSPTGRLFVPIAHGDLRDEVVRAVESCNLAIRAEEHAVFRQGDRYFGALALAGGSGETSYEFVLGLRNSHDHSFAAACALGTRVFVCDNLAFSGEVTFRLKHTRNVTERLRTRSMEAVGQLLQTRDLLSARIATYQTFPLPISPPVHDFLCRALMDGQILASSDIAPVLTSWRTGHYALSDDEPLTREVEVPPTAWGLFNCITHRLKRLNPDELQRRTIRLHALMDSLVGTNVTSGTPDPAAPINQPPPSPELLDIL
jgi:hypothetical protein